jgi:hypothetical protein
MARTACLACLVSTVSGRYKNILRRVSANSGHITKLEQSTLLRYLWVRIRENKKTKTPGLNPSLGKLSYFLAKALPKLLGLVTTNISIRLGVGPRHSAK